MARGAAIAAEERRRDLRPALAVLAFIAFLVGALAWQTDAGQRAERAQALAQSHDLLWRCRDIAESYLREQRQESERRQEEISRLVTSLTEDFQMRIQAALASGARRQEEQPLAALARLWGWAPPAAGDPDWLETALLTASGDLAQRMPPNCSVVICQEGGRLLLRLAGKAPPTSERALEATRRLEFDLHGKPRTWFLTVSLTLPPLPQPTAADLAERLGQRLAWGGSENAMLRGVILDLDGKVLEVFPASAPGPRVMPLPPRSGEWLNIADASPPRLTRLERIALSSAPWSIGMQIAIDAPPLLAAMQRRVCDDWRWAGLFGLSAFALCLCLIAAPLRSLSPAAAPSTAAAPRLVPKTDAARLRGGITFAEVVARDGQTALLVQEVNLPRQ
ncbi:MAG: hypothetical protein N3A66_09050, partial [Planctomycetota bacterium]|nr:hypothetical protein [Planctomycetota bacterium]